MNFTPINTDMASTSTIDHFLVNERLLNLLHLGDNLSRHSPVMLMLNIGKITCKQAQNSTKVQKWPAWYKASHEDIDN